MTKRRYLPGSAILETTFETAEGVVAVTDFMPLTEDEDYVEVVRLVRGVHGHVPMRMELIVRFGYGAIVPWVRRQDFGLRAIAGPDALELHTPVELRGEDLRHGRRVQRRRGRERALRARLSPLAPGGRAAPPLAPEPG